MEAKNVDDILVKSMSEQGVNPPVAEVEKPVEVVPEVSPTPDEAIEESSHASQQQIEPSVEQVESDNKLEEKLSHDNLIDEYGNPVEKPRLYTEEEVNQRIRERLARGKYAEQNHPQETPRQNLQPENTEGEEEDWRVQLRKEIRSELTQAQQEENEKIWRQQEAERQAIFEEKFTSGMTKYSDFQKVIANKPITDSMLMATRSLENPAAFIYGAAKLHPQELTKIAQINDPLIQAAEIGRLHERMVKERKMASSAPKPLDPPKGDMPQKVANNQPSIEERIHSYARQKRK